MASTFAALLALTLLALSPHPAHAQWAPTYTQSASATGGSGPYSSSFTYDPSGNGAAWGGYQSPTLTATVTPVFTWPGPGTAPQLYVRESGTAVSQGSPLGAYASDGLGDPSLFDWMGAPVTHSSGSILKQVPGTKGAAPGTQVSLDAVTLSAGAPNGGGLSVSLTAQPDTRGLTLSRDGAGAPTTDSDGTVHGDTIYSYQDTEPAPSSPFGITMEVTSPVDNWLMFHPNFQGGWSTKAVPVGNGVGSDYDVTWSWSPSESQDDLHDGQWKMPYGSMNKVDGAWVGRPTGTSPGSSMTYTATDNQNPATATAQYILTVHDVNERQPDVLDDPHHLISEVHGNNWANNSGVNETVTFHVDKSSTKVEAFTYSGAVGLDWLKAWGLDVTGTAEYGTQVWDATATGGSGAIVLPPNKYIYPITRVFSHHEEFWVKSYNAGGFTGQAYPKTDSYNGDQSIEYTTSPILDEPGYMR